jgi:uncharacterized damage-inducible protein DinB
MLPEIQSYLALLNDLRGQVKTLLEGLPQEALDWPPIKEKGELSTNSLGAIAAHLAGSEMYWMKEIIDRHPIQRDREAEFVTRGISSADLKARLDASGKTAEGVLSSLKESQLEETRKARERTVTVRWSILHVIEHFAMHVGHMQLTRQLWMAHAQKK